MVLTKIWYKTTTTVLLNAMICFGCHFRDTFDSIHIYNIVKAFKSDFVNFDANVTAFNYKSFY